MSPFGPSFLPQPVVYSQPFDFVGPLFSYLFSYSYELFVVPKKVNSFAIKQIRTLCAKYRGWGGVRRLCALRAVPGRKAGLCGKPHVLSSLPPLCRLFALFFALACFVFKSLQPLFPKHPGGGYLRLFSPLATRHSPPATRHFPARLQRPSGLQYTLPPASPQHRRIYTPPWINA